MGQSEHLGGALPHAHAWNRARLNDIDIMI